MPWSHKQPDLKNNPLYLEPRVTAAETQLASIAVQVEKYPRLGNESDDTGRIQRAIDAAPEGAEILFDPKVNYRFTSVVSTKTLIINFNGANLTVNPYVTQTPAVWFKGSVGIYYSLLADVSERDRTITVTGASTKFQKNDYILIGDNYNTPKWSDGTAGYAGRYEMNMVASVSGDTITLLRQIEWSYAVANSSFVQKVNLLKQPVIKNSGLIKEVDPGAPSTNSPAVAGKGHIFQFQYCLLPTLENCNLDGWQMHALNINFCILANVRNLNGKNPFRPAEGGHGYLIRDDNSVGSVVEKCYAVGVRHMMDWSRSYDCISRDNISQNPSGVSFYTHGTGVKRCKSIDDQVLGANNSEEGWSMGDPGFNADYDFQVINPKYMGTSFAIVMRVGSKGMRVINPWILTRGLYAVCVSRGAKGFIMEGGQIENYNSSTGYYGFLADITTGGSTPVEYPSDITIRGTKFKGNSIVKVEALGTVVLEDLDFDVNITSNSGAGACIRVCETQVPTDLIIKNNRMKGAFDRGIYGTLAPAGRYEVRNNLVQGYRTGGIQLRSANNLRDIDNTVVTTSGVAERGYSGDIVASIAGGSVVRGNEPNTTSASGTFTFSGDGSTATFTITHGLIAKPKKFSVMLGNTVASDAGIRSVTAYTTNITVAFKTAPVTGINNGILYWWAEC